MSKVFKLADLTVKPGERLNSFIEVGQLHDGTPIRMPIMIVNGAQKGPTILVESGEHGDEIVGAVAVARVAKSLDPKRFKGCYVGLPCLNMPSYIFATRVYQVETPGGRNDMHYLYPDATESGTQSQRIAAYLRDKIMPQVEYWIDCHSSAQGSINYSRCIIAGDAVGASSEVQSKIDALAIASGFRVILKPKTKDYTGVFYRPEGFFEKRGIVKVILETGAAPTTQGFELLEEGITNMMKHLNMIDGPKTKSDEQVIAGGMVGVRSNCGGIFFSKVNLGDTVKGGQLLGEVHNLFGDQVEEVRAQVDGIVIKVATSGFAYTGARLFALASF